MGESNWQICMVDWFFLLWSVFPFMVIHYCFKLRHFVAQTSRNLHIKQRKNEQLLAKKGRFWPFIQVNKTLSWRQKMQNLDSIKKSKHKHVSVHVLPFCQNV